MQHLDVRVLRRRYLLCDPQTTPSGRSAGYGNVVRHIEQTVRSGAALGATVFLIRPARPINAALYELSSPDVRIVGHSDWRAPLLRLLWRCSLPVRYGKPVAWFVSTAAGAARRPVEWAKRWSRRRGWRGLDRRLDRVGHRCRRVSHGYERHIVQAWSDVFAEARDRARSTGSKRRRVRVGLRPETEAAAEVLAREMGWDPARPMVSLHVREGGFRTRDAERQRDLDAIRDARIETYAPVVSWLTARGYQVVRLGDPTMTACRWPGVIDLATAPRRTGAVELWALRLSRFFIASDSGPYFLSKLFNIPCLSVNVVQVGYYTFGPRDRYICKHVYDRTLGRGLSVAEMLTDQFMSTALDPQRYEWTDNSPDDIVQAVEDQVALLNQPGEGRTAPQQRHDDLLGALAARRLTAARAEGGLLFRSLGRGTISPRFAGRYLDLGSPAHLERDPRMR